MHPAYVAKHGLRNFEKAEKLYRNKGYVDVKKSFRTGKHRRNAVTELLRFICSEEFPTREDNGSMKDAYERVYKMLLNGDAVGATRALSSAGNHSLALCVSQATSASSSKKLHFRSMHTQEMHSSQSQSFKRIINLISAQSEDYSRFVQGQIGQGQQHSISWQQALCSHLLFILEPQRSLSDVLKQFMAEESCRRLTKTGQNGAEDLLFALLRLYVGDNQAGPEHVATKLRSFCNIEVTKETSRTQEFEMRWLVQYVLRLYSSFETSLDEDGRASNLGI